MFSTLISVNVASEYGVGNDYELEADRYTDIASEYAELAGVDVDTVHDLVVCFEDISGLFAENFSVNEAENLLTALDIFEDVASNTDAVSALEAWVEVHGAHYAKDFDPAKIYYFHGSRSDFGRQYVDEYVGELPSIVDANLDYEGIADGIESAGDVRFSDYGYGIFVIKVA